MRRTSYLQQVLPRAAGRVAAGVPVLTPPRMLFRPNQTPDFVEFDTTGAARSWRAAREGEAGSPAAERTHAVGVGAALMPPAQRFSASAKGGGPLASQGEGNSSSTPGSRGDSGTLAGGSVSSSDALGGVTAKPGRTTAQEADRLAGALRHRRRDSTHTSGTKSPDEEGRTARSMSSGLMLSREGAPDFAGASLLSSSVVTGQSRAASLKRAEQDLLQRARQQRPETSNTTDVAARGQMANMTLASLRGSAVSNAPSDTDGTASKTRREPKQVVGASTASPGDISTIAASQAVSTARAVVSSALAAITPPHAPRAAAMSSRAYDTPSLHIGTLEVRVVPPAPAAAQPQRAAAQPVARRGAGGSHSIARGFGVFGLGQS